MIAYRSVRRIRHSLPLKRHAAERHKVGDYSDNTTGRRRLRSRVIQQVGAVIGRKASATFRGGGFRGAGFGLGFHGGGYPYSADNGYGDYDSGLLSRAAARKDRYGVRYRRMQVCS